VRSDTIAAIATAPGEGAIGIVRLSGPDVAAIGRAVFDGRLRDRRAVYGHVVHPLSGTPIEAGLGLLMLGPRSYTGEHTLELSVHGGAHSLRRVLDATLAAGARAAQPGEFSLRAFLNGRLDLAQAESVLALVRARTDAAADLALSGIEGRLSGKIRDLRGLCLETLAYLGARADFPDEDVPLRDLAPELDLLLRELEALVRGAEYGILQREGVRVVLAGRPNAGKSSLLNRLLGVERAIVTEIPGTTRDTIEEGANLLGLPVVFTDTAGLREAQDPVERIGVDRSRAAIAAGEVVVLVIDASHPLGETDRHLLAEYAQRPLVVALNKSDLGIAVRREELGVDRPAVHLSARTGEGLDRFTAVLRATVEQGARAPDDGTALSTVRQRDAARRALDYVCAARDGYLADVPEDLLSVDLGAAVRALGELTGEDATEDLLDTIFSRFCIGK
jgi:tRNA modification GTPase